MDGAFFDVVEIVDGEGHEREGEADDREDRRAVGPGMTKTAGYTEELNKLDFFSRSGCKIIADDEDERDVWRSSAAQGAKKNRGLDREDGAPRHKLAG